MLARFGGLAVAGGAGAYYLQKNKPAAGPAALAARRNGLAAFAGPVAPDATGPFGNPAVRGSARGACWGARFFCRDFELFSLDGTARPSAALGATSRGSSFFNSSLRHFLFPFTQHGWDYYGKCLVGGILSCGLTHLAVTPLDVVKCRMQTMPE